MESAGIPCGHSPRKQIYPLDNIGTNDRSEESSSRQVCDIRYGSAVREGYCNKGCFSLGIRREILWQQKGLEIGACSPGVGVQDVLEQLHNILKGEAEQPKISLCILAQIT